jgi:protein-S-isoprenylcysteine O-methyltransferase Ste14
VPVPRDREDLCEEHPHGDLGQMIFAFAFIAVWAIDSFWLKLTTFPAASVPLYVRIPVAALLVFMGIYLAVRGHRTVFGEVREPPSVIKSGVFSHIRHPLYLSNILIYLGLIVLTMSLASLILWVIIFIFYDRISAYEEVQLTERFGEEYSEYTEQVPRWLPRPGGFGKH